MSLVFLRPAAHALFAACTNSTEKPQSKHRRAIQFLRHQLRRTIIVQVVASGNPLCYTTLTIQYGVEGELGLLSETLQPYRAPEPGIEEIPRSACEVGK